MRPAYLIAALGLLHGGHANSQAPGSSFEGSKLRAVTETVGLNNGLADCLADTMKLKILDGVKEEWVEDYCSAYGKGGARLVTDERGRHYILLNYSEGKGTRATTDYLKIYEFVDGMPDERVRLVVSEPIGVQADFKHDCTTLTTPGGGLRVECLSKIDGELQPGEHAPSAGQTVVVVR